MGRMVDIAMAATCGETPAFSAACSSNPVPEVLFECLDQATGDLGLIAVLAQFSGKRADAIQ